MLAHSDPLSAGPAWTNRFDHLVSGPRSAPKHIEAGYRNNRAIRLVLEFRLLGLTGSVQAARCHNLEMNTTYKGVDSATMRILMSFPWAVIVGTWEQHATKVLELIRRFGIVSPANEWRRADFARVEVTACLPFR